MQKYVLLTGATGLVGQYLVRDLLLGGERLAVVVRPSKKESATERVERILQMWEAELGKAIERPVCLAGDVAEPGLSLSAADKGWAAANCDRVIHNAATLQFHGADRSGEPWRTNFYGTQHVLDLCRELSVLDLHYVSTAYVCGKRGGTIREDELDSGQAFRNDYEHCKFLAEKAVRDAEFLNQVTVYRPAVIAGDSTTGYTTSYHGLYMYLRVMWMIAQNTEPSPDGIHNVGLQLNMTGEEQRNVVPVDWVARVLCRLFWTPAAHGHTFHLAPTERMTPRQLVEFGYKKFRSRGVDFLKAGQVDKMDTNRQDVEASMAFYEEYEDSDPTFDTTNLQKFAADLPCPPIDDEMLDRFVDFAEEDQWGKRRPAKLRVPFCVQTYLQERVVADTGAEAPAPGGNGHAGDRETLVGLRILGPGGGQWRLRLKEGAVTSFAPGLPVNDAPIVQMHVDEFARSVGGRRSWRSAANFTGAQPDEQATGRWSDAVDSLFAAT